MALPRWKKNGVFDYDMFGHFVTPLVNGRECAFVYHENDIAFCAIEKACKEGKIPSLETDFLPFVR